MAEKDTAMVQKSFVVYGGAMPFTVGASSPGTDSFVINDRADFYPLMITYKSTSDSMTVQFRVSNRNIFDTPILLPLVAGVFTAGNYLPKGVSWRIPAKTNLLIDYKDLSGSINYVYLALVGYEIAVR